jgi:hypothetical protein
VRARSPAVGRAGPGVTGSGRMYGKTRQWQRTCAAPGGGLVGSRRERGVGRGPR